jgi:ubiquinol-cytochrome c reductase cytochrome c1 subunit
MIRRLVHGAAAIALASIASLSLASSTAHAEGETKLLDGNFSFRSLFGTVDVAAAQRGLQIYKEVCSNCHGLYEMSYRNLQGLGYSPDEVKAFAADVQVQDGPDDRGKMFKRPGRPSDPFVRPFANEVVARLSNNGALPPDLALIAKSRKGGVDYVYSLLQGYEEQPPADVTLADGMYYNKYYPGHQIAMPPPLSDGAVTFADGAPNTLKDEAYDIANFLEWAAEPEMTQRKELGVRVMIFLGILTGLLYLVKRRVWADIH